MRTGKSTGAATLLFPLQWFRRGPVRLPSLPDVPLPTPVDAAAPAPNVQHAGDDDMAATAETGGPAEAERGGHPTANLPAKESAAGSATRPASADEPATRDPAAAGENEAVAAQTELTPAVILLASSALPATTEGRRSATASDGPAGSDYAAAADPVVATVGSGLPPVPAVPAQPYEPVPVTADGRPLDGRPVADQDPVRAPPIEATAPRGPCMNRMRHAFHNVRTVDAIPTISRGEPQRWIKRKLALTSRLGAAVRRIGAAEQDVIPPLLPGVSELPC